jgi:hypothetical protein
LAEFCECAGTLATERGREGTWFDQLVGVSEAKMAREGGLRGDRSAYIRVNSVVDAVACKVIGCAAISFVGFGLAFVKAGREPGLEFGVVPGFLDQPNCCLVEGEVQREMVVMGDRRDDGGRNEEVVDSG